MAHVLNHSCEPNCYSRPIETQSIQGDPLGEHVVIVAKEDIPAGEELTYDYRFHSNELLPCNCGAAKCRGWVNVSGKATESYVQIPKAQLKPLVPRGVVG
jgi:SET domain-containing protein